MFFVEYFSKKIRALISHEVKNCLCDYEKISYRDIRNVKDYQLFEIKSALLTEDSLHSNESGISNERLCRDEVIVSLTTYGKRLRDVYITIESIMQGSVKPNRLILWLAEEYEGQELPVTLQKQHNRGLEIRYCKDTRSFKKLIPALQAFPDACIITVDDDVIYPFDFLETLLQSYKANPHAIHANRVHEISIDAKGIPMPYLQWKSCKITGESSILNFATGVGGVLYPPHSLDSRIFDEQSFMTLCPTADDIWFFAMGHLNGYYVSKSPTRDPLGNDFLENQVVQDVALKMVNKLGEHRNDIQLLAVLQKYNISLEEKS